MSRFRSRFKILVFYFIATTLAVVGIGFALEISFRFFVDRDEFFDWIRWHPTRLYVSNPKAKNFNYGLGWNINSLGFRGEELEEKSKPRILCLGDSRTFGFGVDDNQSYPAHLQEFFSDYEVINAGTPGYTSMQGWLQCQDVFPVVKPDIVIAGYGFNDRRYVVHHRYADSPDVFRELYAKYRIHFFFYQSRIYQYITQHRFKGLSQKPPLTTLAPRVNTLTYKNNLRNITLYCMRKGVPIVLLFFGDHPQKFAIFEQGVEALQAGEYKKSVAYLKQAQESKSQDVYTVATYYLILALQSMGDFESADSYQKDYAFEYYFPGVRLIRSRHSYLQATKNIANRYDYPMIDFRALVEDDSNYYLDECHPTAEGYEILAEALHDTIVQEFNVP